MQTSAPSLRSDFALREVVDTHALEQAVFTTGVTRLLIEQDGGHPARTTTVLRFGAGAEIPVNPLGNGEELLVLSGEFADEHNTYAAGSYVRNAQSTVRRTDGGCVLFQKVGHLSIDDLQPLIVDTRNASWQPGMYAGLRNLLLAAIGTERTVLVRWAPGTQIPAHTHGTVEETLVLEGELQDEFGRYPAGTWFRVPVGSTHAPSSPSGALILIKVGHVREEMLV